LASGDIRDFGSESKDFTLPQRKDGIPMVTQKPQGFESFLHRQTSNSILVPKGQLAKAKRASEPNSPNAPLKLSFETVTLENFIWSWLLFRL